MQAIPNIERVRHELKRRALTVKTVEKLTPCMLRITLAGDDLADFTSLAADDHCKVIVPDENGENVMRDYTPRAYDNAARSLVIDFAVHDAGPATRWALAAKVGDTVEIGGPRGSAVLKGAIDRMVLIGDETALPAIGRQIEEAAPGAKIEAIVAVPSPEDEQAFATAADLSIRWIHRPEAQATEPSHFIEALADVTLGEGTYVWIAAEAGVAKAIRRHLIDELNHPLTWMKSAGYWVKGQADTSEKNISE